jgi:hypothetical protein
MSAVTGVERYAVLSSSVLKIFENEKAVSCWESPC